MHNNELYENVRTRDYCAITAKVKGERVSRSAHTTILFESPSVAQYSGNESSCNLQHFGV